MYTRCNGTWVQSNFIAATQSHGKHKIGQSQRMHFRLTSVTSHWFRPDLVLCLQKLLAGVPSKRVNLLPVQTISFPAIFFSVRPPIFTSAVDTQPKCLQETKNTTSPTKTQQKKCGEAVGPPYRTSNVAKARMGSTIPSFCLLMPVSFVHGVEW